jgi:hypothetical protein
MAIGGNDEHLFVAVMDIARKVGECDRYRYTWKDEADSSGGQCG